MTQYITQAQAAKLAKAVGMAGMLTDVVCSLNEVHTVCNAAIQHYIDSLPKSEPVAWIVQGTEENILGVLTHQRDVDYYQSDIEELPVGTKLYTQPALSKEDMVKLLEALEYHVAQTRPIASTDEAINIMQSAIGVAK
jgi:hypothetical protein